MSEAHILSSSPASFQRFPLIMRHKNGVGEFLFFASFKIYDCFSEENACFFNSQSLTACQKQSTHNENFPTPFLREMCQENIGSLVVFFRSDPTGNELN